MQLDRGRERLSVPQTGDTVEQTCPPVLNTREKLHVQLALCLSVVTDDKPQAIATVAE